MSCREQVILTTFRKYCDANVSYTFFLRNALYCVAAKKWLSLEIRTSFLERAFAKPIKMFEDAFLCTDDAGRLSEDEFLRVFRFTDDELKALMPEQREAVMSLRCSSFVMTLEELMRFAETGLFDAPKGCEWQVLKDFPNSKECGATLDPFWIPTALQIMVEIMSSLTTFSVS